MDKIEFDIVNNSKRNIIFGILNKAIVIIMPFFVRGIIIHYIGLNYLGLDSLFSSLLKVLNMSELGFSSAIVSSMYEPIAKNDKKKLRAILKYYKFIYKIVGTVILVLGLIIFPFIPNLIKEDAPTDINLYCLFFIYLINTVISYWLFAYRSSVLNAYQRNDVISIINTITKVFCYGTQIFVLVICKNYYLYTSILLLTSILENVLIFHMTNNMYPDILPNGYLDIDNIQAIKTKVKGLVIVKISQVSRNAFDSIFISFFVGLSSVAIYNNYYLIMHALNVLLSVVGTSIQSGIGNRVVLNTPEKNHKDMIIINFAYLGIACICLACFINLIQPFTVICFGNDVLFPFGTVILFGIYFYVLCMGDIRTVYVIANGLWWENRYVSLAEAIFNIILNLVMGKLFGVNGIILATLVSLFVIGFVCEANVIYMYYFKSNRVSEYYIENIICGVATFIAVICSYFVCSTIVVGNMFILLLLRLFASVSISASVFCLVTCKTWYFNCLQKRIKKIKNDKKVNKQDSL